jgi:hypothetical protein
MYGACWPRAATIGPSCPLAPGEPDFGVLWRAYVRQFDRHRRLGALMGAVGPYY